MRRRHMLHGLLLGPWWLGGVVPRTAWAQAASLSNLQLSRGDGALLLDFAVRLQLPRAVEDALQRGVPMYFVASATVRRSRWYWRDARIARVRRTWRLAFQPLTATWRVSLGALSQNHDTLPEALASLSASAGWPVCELSQLAPDGDYVEFAYALDTERLPRPMQIGLPGASDWVLRVERELKVPAS
ncbi:DUF4390 domain-containing protein [Rubrivivax albus]|uniref:DUF4390 domain-containing protein n=1 Tax=Rubrivivax albus TaxID=2499835 RepID=A0A3S2U9L2_9BURK|nr:DUF4390 domain-containing protein [Rubrivivax albus]RVT52375.1 DUF4390 domain-containing protein [Rubrivivax albus]